MIPSSTRKQADGPEVEEKDYTCLREIAADLVFPLSRGREILESHVLQFDFAEDGHEGITVVQCEIRAVGATECRPMFAGAHTHVEGKPPTRQEPGAQVSKSGIIRFLGRRRRLLKALNLLREFRCDIGQGRHSV